MHATEARDKANEINNIDSDKLDDRVLAGIDIEIYEASKNGLYSIEYNFTAGLTFADLLYCQDKLEERGFKVEIRNNEILKIEWSRAKELF